MKHVKNIALAMLLGFASVSNANAANWVKLGEYKKGEFVSYDTESMLITSSINMVQVWMRFEYPSAAKCTLPFEIDKNNICKIDRLLTFFCDTRRAAFADTSGLFNIAPETPEESMCKIMCTK